MNINYPIFSRTLFSNIFAVNSPGDYWWEVCSHWKKKKKKTLFLALEKITFIKQLAYAGTLKKGKKFSNKYINNVQFVVIFILLHHGRPVSDMPSMSEVLDLLCVPHYPKEHWSKSIGWGIANCLNEVVLAKTSLLMHNPSICQFHITSLFLVIPVTDKCACLGHARLGSASFDCGIEKDN